MSPSAKWSSEQRVSIKEFLASVLTTTRPEEVLLVDTVFDKTVDVTGKGNGLGFGGGVQVILWLYPLLDVLSDFAKDVGKGFAEKWGEQLADWLHKPDSGKDL